MMNRNRISVITMHPGEVSGITYLKFQLWEICFKLQNSNMAAYIPEYCHFGANQAILVLKILFIGYGEAF